MLYCIVSGNVKFDDYGKMCKALDEIFIGRKTVYIVTGDDKGADKLALQYAKEHDGCVPKVFYADWASFHREAGKLRTQNMYSYVAKHDEKLAVLFGDSDGATGYKAKIGKEYGIPTKRIF